MTRRELGGLLDGLASRRSGYSRPVYAADKGIAPFEAPNASRVDSERIQRSLKGRFGERAPQVKG